MIDWKSTVMRCNVGDDHCALCRVSGDFETASANDLRAAVQVLDARLAENEHAAGELAVMLSDLIRLSN